VQTLYKENRSALDEVSHQLVEAMRPEREARGEITQSLIDEAVAVILGQAHTEHGGFGSAPKEGFGASQDADVTPDDEGGYFTWTAAQFREVLDDDVSCELLTRFYLHPAGAMHHAPERHVLAETRSLEVIAGEIGLEYSDALRLADRGRRRLLDSRRKRVTPLIDRGRYTSLNGLAAGSLIRAAAVLADKDLLAHALSSLEYIVAARFRSEGLFHSESVGACAEDYVMPADALIVAYEATAQPRYLTQACRLVEEFQRLFQDAADGGFFDTNDAVLGVRMKPMDDIPHPSVNSIAANVLMKLYRITDVQRYFSDAEQAIRCNAGRASRAGLHAGSWFGALQARFHGWTFKICDAPDGDLVRAMRAVWGPNITIRYEAERSAQ